MEQLQLFIMSHNQNPPFCEIHCVSVSAHRSANDHSTFSFSYPFFIKSFFTHTYALHTHTSLLCLLCLVTDNIAMRPNLLCQCRLHRLSMSCPRVLRQLICCDDASSGGGYLTYYKDLFFHSHSLWSRFCF